MWLGHDIDNHPEVPFMRRGDQKVDIGKRAVHRIDTARISDVVPGILLG